MDELDPIRASVAAINEHLIDISGKLGELAGDVRSMAAKCDERGTFCRERFASLQRPAGESSGEQYEAMVRLSPKAWAALVGCLAALSGAFAALCRVIK